jgi:hypothetical protein
MIAFFVILERDLRHEGGLAHVLDWTGNDDNIDIYDFRFEREEKEKVGVDDGQFLSKVSFSNKSSLYVDLRSSTVFTKHLSEDH